MWHLRGDRVAALTALARVVGRLTVHRLGRLVRGAVRVVVRVGLRVSVANDEHSSAPHQ